MEAKKVIGEKGVVTSMKEKGREEREMMLRKTGDGV